MKRTRHYFVLHGKTGLTIMLHVTLKKCYTSWSISRWYFKNYKKDSLCSLHTEIPLSSQEEHDVGAQSKTQTSYKFRQHVAYKQAVGHSVSQLKY